MKKILLTALLISPIMVFAQTGSYTLKGKVGSLNSPAKAYLIQAAENGRQTDSAMVKNGAFEFKGTVNSPRKAMLVLDHKGGGLESLRQGADVLEVYLEKGTISFTSPDSVAKAKFTGSKLNADNQKLRETLKPIQDKAQSLMAEYRSAPAAQQQSEAFQAEYADRYQVIVEEQNQILEKFIKANPQTLVSLDALVSLGGAAPEYSEVAPLFNSLSAEVKNSEVGKQYGQALDKLKVTALGATAPDFTQNTPEGKPVKLSDFKGKYVLIDFWASWCGPCRQENPNVVKVYNQYKDKNFTILGVSLDNEKGREAWLKAINDDQLTWTQVSDLQYWRNEVALQYGVQSIPQNFLIDPNGKIIAKNLRGEALGDKLAELIK
ncbi:redoxin domain-containing protein [Pontibacter silvestris]|uniref:Redoxin domain-containing protein n=1 Tax=Pontibacter silvestris TaxID=2305183 RepID=A0ABW4WUI7_9BACT|nr:TlpA disulfide reductase family protein [Pontibacter silvestris]MCC9138114.1 AhpC/TSA family protein [Pontibacter silvestris]